MALTPSKGSLSAQIHTIPITYCSTISPLLTKQYDFKSNNSFYAILICPNHAGEANTTLQDVSYLFRNLNLAKPIPVTILTSTIISAIFRTEIHLFTSSASN